MDESWTAKLSIFGFLVSIPPGEDFFQGNSIDGTIGYIYPEYLDTLRVTKKCDVYGFGVELVEVLTGHHPVEIFLGFINLVSSRRNFPRVYKFGRLLCFVNGRELHIANR